MYDIHFIQQALIDKGVQRVHIYRDKELKFSCPLDHEDENPSAYLIFDKEFFKCFSCGKVLSLEYFLRKMRIKSTLSEGFLKSKKHMTIDINSFSSRPERKPKSNFNQGLHKFNNAGDYRLHPDVVGYLEMRLGKGFKLPPFVSVRKDDERDSILYRGKEDLITEKFPPRMTIRFVNYGDNCLMHHLTEPVDDLVVVEGFFDYLKVYQVYPNVCALMTTSLSGEKLRQLESISKDRVHLFMDNDKGGRSAEANLQKRLIAIRRRPSTIEYQRKELTDPCAMSYNDLHEHLKELLNDQAVLCNPRGEA